MNFKLHLKCASRRCMAKHIEAHIQCKLHEFNGLILWASKREYDKVVVRLGLNIRASKIYGYIDKLKYILSQTLVPLCFVWIDSIFFFLVKIEWPKVSKFCHLDSTRKICDYSWFLVGLFVWCLGQVIATLCRCMERTRAFFVRPIFIYLFNGKSMLLMLAHSHALLLAKKEMKWSTKIVTDSETVRPKSNVLTNWHAIRVWHHFYIVTLRHCRNHPSPSPPPSNNSPFANRFFDIQQRASSFHT